MAKHDIPTPQELRKLLRYEPETGKLFWKRRTPDMFNECSQGRERRCAIWNTKFAEKEALASSEGRGSLHGRIFNKAYKAHRVAWALYNGEWPTHEIDHINHIPNDNRIANLRCVIGRENSRNLPMRIDNNSGATGVAWHKKAGKWRARIKVDRDLHLGLFDTFEDALAARRSAEAKYKFHPNHGRD